MVENSSQRCLTTPEGKSSRRCRNRLGLSGLICSRSGNSSNTLRCPGKWCFPQGNPCWDDILLWPIAGFFQGWGGQYVVRKLLIGVWKQQPATVSTNGPPKKGQMRWFHVESGLMFTTNTSVQVIFGQIFLFHPSKAFWAWPFPVPEKIARHHEQKPLHWIGLLRQTKRLVFTLSCTCDLH